MNSYNPNKTKKVFYDKNGFKKPDFNEEITKATIENSDFIIKLRKDLKMGFGKFFICTGKPGTGKSFAALRLGEIVDDDFGLHKVIVGDNLGFVSLLEKALNKEFDNGAFLLFDEAGLGMSSREWNRKQNKLMSVIFQLIRKMGLCVVFTVPTLNMIDVTARRIANYWMDAIGVNLKTKRSSFKLWWLDYNNYFDKIYRHNFKQGGKEIRVWQFKLPQRIDLDKYEVKKDATIKGLLTEARDILTPKEIEAAKPTGRPPYYKDKVIEMLGEGKNPGLISDTLGCTPDTVYKILRKIER